MGTKTKFVFGNQPAQYVILDLGFPMILNARENMIIALQNVLSLACFMQGSNRIPSFGMSVINSAYQSFVKLMPAYRNYSLISKALKNINNMNKSRMHINTDDFKDAIHVAISTALDEFRMCCEQMEYSDDMNDPPSQIQISFFSMKDGVYLQNCIENAIQISPIEKIKKIQVIHLTDNMLSQMDPEHSFVCGFVELIKVPYSVLSIEKFVKNWLLDCNTDAEKLNLILPGIVLKCDTVECLINPLMLPFGNNYQLQPIGPPAFSHQELAGKRSHHDLEIISRMSADGLCESQIYGHPIGLVPTKCWKLDRTEQVSNQQCFHALCKSLLSSNEYIIAKMCTEDQRNVHTAYFVLLPGLGIILAKPMAGREFVLPVHEELMEEESSQAAVQGVNRSLTQLSKINEFQPSKYECGLYKALQNSTHYLQEIQKKASKPPVAKKPATGAVKRVHPALSSPQAQNKDGHKSQKIVHFFKPVSQVEHFFTE